MLLNTVSEVQEWVVTEEGAQIAKEGSHEAAVFNAIPASGSLSQADLQVGKLKDRNGLVSIISFVFIFIFIFFHFRLFFHSLTSF